MMNVHSETSARPRIAPWQMKVPATECRSVAQRDAFDALDQVGLRIRVPRGAEVFAEGDENAFCYRIVSGDAMAVKLMSDGRRQVYEFLLPGDYLGFESQDAHYFGVEALTDLVLFKYPRPQVERMLAENPKFASAIQRMTARGLHTAYQRMLLLSHKSAEERIAWFLLTMAERTNTTGTVHLAMSRTDIADYLGMVIETVSRALSRFKRAGTIAMGGVNDIRLVDRRRLEVVRGDI